MKEKLISGGVTTVTGATGMAGMIAMIPDGITKVACLAGIFGTIVVIASTLVKSRYDSQKAVLEIRKLKQEIKKNG